MQAMNSANSRGVDVSHYQNVTCWNSVKNAGYSFASVKATEGQSIVDSKLTSHVNGAKEAGLKVSVYHFCRAHDVDSAQKEADFFISVVMDQLGGFDNLDIAPSLDLETAEGGTRDNIVAIAKTWIDRVREASGMNVTLYSYPYFIDTYFDESLATYPLWLASYGSDHPADRNGWSAYEFVQYSDKGQVDGIDGNVDLDEYCGDINDYNPYLEDEKVKFKHDYQWDMLKQVLQNCYDKSVNGEIVPPVLSNYEWAQSAYDEDMNVSDLAWLAIVLWAKHNKVID